MCHLEKMFFKGLTGWWVGGISEKVRVFTSGGHIRVFMQIRKWIITHSSAFFFFSLMSFFPHVPSYFVLVINTLSVRSRVLA